MQKLPINPFLDFYATPDAMIINPFVFGGGAFDPLTLSPALWLSDTGADAATWPDLSGNGRDATQADAAKQPAIVTGALNGRQVRRFDGVDDFLTATVATSPDAFTVVAVIKKISGSSANFRVATSWGTGANSTLWQGWNITDGKQTASMSDAANDLKGLVQNGPSVYSSVVTGPTSKVFSAWIDGVLVGTTTASLAARPGDVLTLGNYSTGSFFTNCDIAEILVFPTALGTTDRQNVEAYLNAKYNIY